MTSLAAAHVVEFDPLKDSRHRDAKSAREQADWLIWLKLGGTRARTVSDYEWATARLMRMFPHKTLGELTDRDLIHVIATFPERSRKVRVAALASWFKWAVRTRVITENPMNYLPEIRKPPAKARDIFTDPEVELLLGLPVADGTLMRILFEAGLRRGEARRLQVKHIRPEPMPGQLVVIDGKGGKDRIVPLTRTLSQALAELQLTEGLNRDDHFWYMRPGGGKPRRANLPARSNSASPTKPTRGCSSSRAVTARSARTSRRRGGSTSTTTTRPGACAASSATHATADCGTVRQRNGW